MRKLIKIFFTFYLLLFLSACTHLTNNYCSANLEYDEAEDCQPKTFNQSYRVYGKTYHVLKSSKNYEEEGNASWYGRRFNHRRTVSGERFNMQKMTAAHKTLPLRTHVRVTNLLNGKQVEVRINDRGPFVSNRLIDLSYVAAKKLGMIGHGVVPVRVTAI